MSRKRIWRLEGSDLGGGGWGVGGGEFLQWTREKERRSSETMTGQREKKSKLFLNRKLIIEKGLAIVRQT